MKQQKETLPQNLIVTRILFIERKKIYNQKIKIEKKNYMKKRIFN